MKDWMRSAGWGFVVMGPVAMIFGALMLTNIIELGPIRPGKIAGALELAAKKDALGQVFGFVALMMGAAFSVVGSLFLWLSRRI